LLIEFFGATSVESFDNSASEGATHIVNMNEPIAFDVGFDTILDGGTLEHIFNVPQALANVSGICADGGRILHVLPANNQCGHGFWQFSPELFLTLYSDANGYEETEVFLAPLSNWNVWYECRKPPEGCRVDFGSLGSGRLAVLASITKSRDVRGANIQKSDYVHAWTKQTSRRGHRGDLKSRIRNSAFWPWHERRRI
jgi:hypothetical protein